MKYIKKFNESKNLDIWGDMRSKGISSDQCSEISDYINNEYLPKKENDIWSDMRSMGFTSDQCSEISDYIESNFIKEAPNWSKEKVDNLINTTNDAENFLAYVKGGMKGEYDSKKKY